MKIYQDTQLLYYKLFETFLNCGYQYAKRITTTTTSAPAATTSAAAATAQKKMFNQQITNQGYYKSRS